MRPCVPVMMICAMLFALPRMLQSAPVHPASGGVRFTENRGQVTDLHGIPCSDVRFSARVGSTTVHVRSTGLSWLFTDQTTESLTRIDMTLVGARSDARITSIDPLPGVANFYLPGRAPILGVPEYSSVVYSNVYEGIDLELLSVAGALKYNFIVHPGGNPRVICMRYSGAASLTISDDGALEITGAGMRMRDEAPIAHAGDPEQRVDSRFVLEGSDVRFHVGSYDTRETLVIDPFATYFGGSATDRANDVAQWRDPATSTQYYYITGVATSPGMPGPTGGTYTTMQPGTDLFLTKLDAAGWPVWTTYFGGSGGDYGTDLVIDAAGNIIVFGGTNSTNLPVTPGCFQPVVGQKPGFSISDVMLAKFTSAGIVVWATYFGGPEVEMPGDVTVDAAGNVYMACAAVSAGLGTSGTFQPTLGKNRGLECLITKFTPSGARVWATYFGGGLNEIPHGICVDAAQNVYFTGYTEGSKFPVSSGAFQTVYRGLRDGFLAKLTPTGGRAWATYIGGAAEDIGIGVTLDPSGNVILAGSSQSTNFPVTTGALQTQLLGTQDLFTAKFTPAGARVWSTYLGGSDSDIGRDVCTDAAGNIYLAGLTQSTNVLAAQTMIGSNAGGQDMLMLSLTSSGGFRWGRYLGGLYTDALYSVCADAAGNVVFAGSARSAGVPVSTGAYQSTYMGTPNGSDDAYIVSVASATGLFKQIVAPHGTPSSINLGPNHPNPVGGSAGTLTRIPFELAEAGMVRIAITDLLGRVVATPVDAYFGAGAHVVSFDAAALPAGTYLYTLQMATETRTRAMQIRR
jgi:hypothetical protein